MDRLRGQHFLWVFQFSLVFFTLGTKAYNMDTRWPLVFTGQESTLFGFSVALHQEGDQHMLLVGAPHMDNEGEIDREGGFYRCNINDFTYTGPCDQVELADQTQPRNDDGFQIGNRSNSFLGATVRSGGTNGPILVCAPSYVWYINPARRPQDGHREPVGGCYIVQNNFQSIIKYEPCVRNDKSTWFEIKLTHCQAGTGGDISMHHVLLGGPGSFFWQGQIFRREVNDPQSEIHTWEGPYEFDDSYRGYTVLLGDLNNDGLLDNVVGIPRAPNMFGAVSVYDHTLRPLFNKSGNQLGEFFGNSLAVTDLDNNGMDDLIVGAPMYTHQEQRTVNYEIGRIYIFYQQRRRGRSILTSKKTIIGHNGRGRFGFSLAALGDINKDGYNDLAVGAPFDNEGAVYIFSGGQRGIVTTPLQIVRPSQLTISGSPLRGFGFSLSGGQDVDRNSYPDLGIGSQTSSHAVVLRSRPVVSVQTEILFSVENIDLSKTVYNLSSNAVPSFNITTCVTYTGQGTSDMLPFSFELQLDSAKTVSSRVQIITGSGQSVREVTWEKILNKGEEDCRTYQAYVERLLRDKISPVEFKFSYDLLEDSIELNDGELVPILPEGAFQTRQLGLLSNCSNAKCSPYLGIGISHDLTEVVVGKTDMLNVDVEFRNDGDEALEARLYAHTPSGVSFIRVERFSSDVVVVCEEVAHLSGDSRVICDVGNPVRANYMVPFRLYFDVSLDDKVNESLIVHFLANSSNIDANAPPVTQDISIPINISYTIDFSGYSNPGQSVYTTNFTLSENLTRAHDAGPDIFHYYIFENSGPSDIGESTLTIQWPSYTLDNDYLLYLYSVTPSVGECQVPDGELNPKKLDVANNIKANNETLAEIVTNSRAKRLAVDEDDDDVDNEQTSPERLTSIDCVNGKCVEITCHFEKLGGNDQPIVVSIRSTLWLKTLTQVVEDNIAPSDWLITSSAKLIVQNSAYTIGNPLPEPMTTTAMTKALPESQLSYVTKPFPWWAYLLAALLGFIVLSCLILTAWKLGFFKRKKIGEDEDNFVK